MTGAYNAHQEPPCLWLRARGSVLTKSSARSAPGAWVRCTAPATRGSGATSRSRSCPVDLARRSGSPPRGSSRKRGRRRALPPAHRRALRRRRARRRAVPRVGDCSRARRCADALHGGALPVGKAVEFGRPDREGPGRGPRPGHRPPRPQAGERVPHERRPREAAGLRHREAAAAPAPSDDNAPTDDRAATTERGRAWARWATWRPSRCAVCRATTGPTSSRSGACSTRCCRGTGRSGATRPPTRCRRSSRKTRGRSPTCASRSRRRCSRSWTGAWRSGRRDRFSSAHDLALALAAAATGSGAGEGRHGAERCPGSGGRDGRGAAGERLRSTGATADRAAANRDRFRHAHAGASCRWRAPECTCAAHGSRWGCSSWSAPSPPRRGSACSVASPLGAQRRASRYPPPAEGRANAGGICPGAAGREVPCPTIPSCSR